MSENPEIGRYKVLKRLGGGGFGEVFLGEDPAIGRQVAIKVFKPKDENLIAFATSSAEEGLEILRARFLNEAKILASLEDHPNIVTVHEYGELDDGAPFYVMPYLPNSFSDELGKDVFDVNALEELPEDQRPRALPLDRALEILEQILTGLAAAHAKGLIHRDIKPSNLMLSESGQLRIVDFGIAKAPDGQHSTVSHLGLGSRNYMAPEQRESAKHVDARADLYSVGVVAYRMITGKLPIGRFADPNVAVPALGQPMNDFLLSMMAVDKTERPGDGAKALEKFQQARKSVGADDRSSDTGTWVGEGEAGMRDELKPLRAKIAEVVGERGLIRPADREGLVALAAIAELEENDLDRLIEDVIKGDKTLAAKQRLARVIQTRVKAQQGPLGEDTLASYDSAAAAVDWDRAKIEQLVEQAVADLADTAGSDVGSRKKRTAGTSFNLPLKPLAAALAVIVLLSAGGWGIHQWRQGQIEAEQAERERAAAAAEAQAAWREAQVEDSIEGYNAYLSQWPDGLNAEDARERIEQLEAQGESIIARVQGYLNRLDYRVPESGELDPRTESAIRSFEEAQGLPVAGTADQVLLESLVTEYDRRDEAAWAQAQDQDTEAAFESYRSEFPQGQYIDQIDERIAQVRDREAWESAVAENTESAFEQYSKDYPGGQYVDQAENRISAIRRAEAEAEARRQLISSIQSELQRLDRSVSVDGALGPGTAEQIRAFENATDRSETGEATDTLLAQLKNTDKWPLPEPGEVFRDCPECPEMVVIPRGRFQMGIPAKHENYHDDEGPQHSVSMPLFALAKTEVTVGEFRRFNEATGYRTDAERNAGDNAGCYSYKRGGFGWTAGTSWRDPGFSQNDSHPVVCVSWNDAQAYVRWLSDETDEDYRLPSEAEQEYALRAGSTSPYPWGSSADSACTHGNVLDRTASTSKFSDMSSIAVECTDNRVFTAPVGGYRANAFGLSDMSGNVTEWAQDCLNKGYNGAPTNGSAWMSGDCNLAMLRGGHFLSGKSKKQLHSAGRFGDPRHQRVATTGFRPARSL
ncbi:MAG: SUMF1/EgtB/PvdO family nonheme iron enzyme [Xanthomonadales bacterium]|nr:SUMF1/EgtB/PvdO family nonheme iron enzyme [Xanthomonadales bacterium]